MDGDERRSD
ncbi:unnamed protein product [Acanthoscelides obtectus]|uniref:Uncharacterized protein n=1 Tax=Acanthoscelides obtectus TaxID=200917 RepID=A0A9P0M613_ACAOB|nr:unnamed protein product [Acanthoscelides obtectus]